MICKFRQPVLLFLSELLVDSSPSRYRTAVRSNNAEGRSRLEEIIGIKSIHLFVFWNFKEGTVHLIEFEFRCSLVFNLQRLVSSSVVYVSTHILCSPIKLGAAVFTPIPIPFDGRWTNLKTFTLRFFCRWSVYIVTFNAWIEKMMFLFSLLLFE